MSEVDHCFNPSDDDADRAAIQYQRAVEHGGIDGEDVLADTKEMLANVLAGLDVFRGEAKEIRAVKGPVPTSITDRLVSEAISFDTTMRAPQTPASVALRISQGRRAGVFLSFTLETLLDTKDPEEPVPMNYSLTVARAHTQDRKHMSHTYMAKLSRHRTASGDTRWEGVIRDSLANTLGRRAVDAREAMTAYDLGRMQDNVTLGLQQMRQLKRK